MDSVVDSAEPEEPKLLVLSVHSEAVRLDVAILPIVPHEQQDVVLPGKANAVLDSRLIERRGRIKQALLHWTQLTRVVLDGLLEAVSKAFGELLRRARSAGLRLRSELSTDALIDLLLQSFEEGGHSGIVMRIEPRLTLRERPEVENMPSWYRPGSLISAESLPTLSISQTR